MYCTIVRIILRALFGGSFKVVHVDPKGTRNVFWCDTWNDALEWANCGHKEDTVRITSACGYVLCERDSLKDF